MFAVNRRTDEGKRQRRQGCVLSRERHGDIGYGVLFTAVGLLNTKNRKTLFVWRPAFFANDVDGPPPVFVEPICFGASRVKLGRQEGTNFRDVIFDRMSMVSDMRR